MSANLGLTKTAAASEAREPPSTEKADPELENDAAAGPELAAVDLSAELDVRENQRGVLLTVPGDLLWETDSDRVLGAAEPQLAEAARLLERYDDRRAMIVGHSDAYGQRDYNRQLSERRAEAVRELLIDVHGIDGDRLETRGMGEDQPIASNETTEGRQANRRIEIQIFN